MGVLFWLIAIVVFLAIEIATLGLTTIWFAAGALVAFIATLLGAGIYVQFVLFIVISIVLLVFTRPWAKRYINRNTVRTNYEELYGKTARVIVPIDNIKTAGMAEVNGQEWTARSLDDTVTFREGDLVTIVDIKGVKLIVEAKKEETE